MAEKGNSLNIPFDDNLVMFYGGEKLTVTLFSSADKRLSGM